MVEPVERVEVSAADYPNEHWIGIDLGTSNVCVSHWVVNKHGPGGKIEIIENQEGKYLTPSVVAFKDVDTEIVGEQAN